MLSNKGWQNLFLLAFVFCANSAHAGKYKVSLGAGLTLNKAIYSAYSNNATNLMLRNIYINCRGPFQVTLETNFNIFNFGVNIFHYSTKFSLSGKEGSINNIYNYVRYNCYASEFFVKKKIKSNYAVSLGIGFNKVYVISDGYSYKNITNYIGFDYHFSDSFDDAIFRFKPLVSVSFYKQFKGYFKRLEFEAKCFAAITRFGSYEMNLFRVDGTIETLKFKNAQFVNLGLVMKYKL